MRGGGHIQNQNLDPRGYLHNLCDSEQYRTSKNIFIKPWIVDLAKSFPGIADTIAFKNHVYAKLFADQMIIVYN